MNLTVSDQPDIRKVSVLGTVESESEAHAIVTACATARFSCEISFFDARTLPPAAIEGLATLFQRGKPIKIYTYEIFLMHSLARLGLPVIQIKYRAINSRLKKITALVIGGSAESLMPLLRIIENLPISALTIFIVQHIPEDKKNILDQLLRIRTGYQIIIPIHGKPINSGTIYIAPPGHHLQVAHGQIYLTRDPKVQFARPSLDVLFESVAIEYGAQALAILLCGFGQDGVRGCAAIRHHGGCVLVEDSAECHSAHVLPNSAKAAQTYDYVLDLAGIICFLASLVIIGRVAFAPTERINSSAEPAPEPLPDHLQNSQLINLFLDAVYSHYGYDFHVYQIGTVKRRIKKLIALLGVNDFFDLQLEILSNPASFELLFIEMSVPVTEFFRHPQQFRGLREEILPYLNSFPRIKIWCAGCATGEEVYSLAIILHELEMLEKSTLFATDMNPYVLQQAESGFFPLVTCEKGRNNYFCSGAKGNFDMYLADCCDLFFKIAPYLQKRILFHRHSLTHDGIFNEFQIIMCRNVLIYFKPKIQQEVLERFARSLHRDGFLILGPSESIYPGNGTRFFSNYQGARHIYRCR